jgi:hypothetical protein
VIGPPDQVAYAAWSPYTDASELAPELDRQANDFAAAANNGQRCWTDRLVAFGNRLVTFGSCNHLLIRSRYSLDARDHSLNEVLRSGRFWRKAGLAT